MSELKTAQPGTYEFDHFAITVNLKPAGPRPDYSGKAMNPEFILSVNPFFKLRCPATDFACDRGLNWINMRLARTQGIRF